MLCKALDQQCVLYGTVPIQLKKYTYFWRVEGPTGPTRKSFPALTIHVEVKYPPSGSRIDNLCSLHNTIICSFYIHISKLKLYPLCFETMSVCIKQLMKCRFSFQRHDFLSLRNFVTSWFGKFPQNNAPGHAHIDCGLQQKLMKQILLLLSATYGKQLPVTRFLAVGTNICDNS